MLRSLVAFEVLADFLDCVSERSPDTRNGLQLHRALREALDPSLPTSDYYKHNNWRGDGGYVLALVTVCRQTVGGLPSYEQVRPLAIRAAELAQVLALNHDPDPARRDTALSAWAAANFPSGGELAWFELAASASAWLTVLALLAYATDPGGSKHEAHAIFDAYLPWVSLAGTMLDSYSDASEDEQQGDHSYIAHYPPGHATARVGEIISRALRETSRLPHGRRHMALSGCMVAMYLSKDSVRTTASIDATRELARKAGGLPRLLIPVLRFWRIAYGQTSDRAIEPPAALSYPRRQLPPSAPLPVQAQTIAFWRRPHAYLAWCRRRYGPTFTVRAVGMAPLVFFSDPQDIKAIVRAPPDALHPGAGASVIAPLVGDGSFMLAEGDTHLAGRRKVLPAFAHAKVQQHTEMICNTAQSEIARWPRDRPVALHPYLRALSLRIILQTIFPSTKPTDELHRLLIAMLSVTGSLALQEPQLRVSPPWRGIWRRFLSHRMCVNELLERLIQEEAHAGAHESGLLALMLNPNIQQHDPVQLREDLMSVILAGHETTASELAWALQLLAHNPPVAARLADSIAVGDDSYLKATVYEVLRHRPVFLFTIPRVCNRPYELGGRTYLPPEQLVGCIHLMHHDPTLYEHPDRFQPERFLATEPPSPIWMPWGGGRKRCPGHHLATLEMQIVIRAVVEAVEILPAQARIEPAHWRSVIVTPGGGCRVTLRSRRTQPQSHEIMRSAPFF